MIPLRRAALGLVAVMLFAWAAAGQPGPDYMGPPLTGKVPMGDKVPTGGRLVVYASSGNPVDGVLESAGCPVFVCEMGAEGFPEELQGPRAMAGPVIGNCGMGCGMYGVTFQNWRGFALEDNESHVLRMSVERVMLVDPMEVRRLLTANVTLGEIRAQIQEMDKDATRGYMRLGQDIYRLVNITLPQDDDVSTLAADVAEARFFAEGEDLKPLSLNDTSIVGHIEVKIASDEYEVSEGSLTMSGGKYIGVYKVLLDARYPAQQVLMGEEPYDARHRKGPGPDHS